MDITLREYFEAEIRHLRELRQADKKALDLQAKEYERRLTALNHAHEEAVRVQHTYVTQDKYEDFILRFNKREIEVDKILSSRSGTTEGIHSVWDIILKVLPIIISVATLMYVIYRP